MEKECIVPIVIPSYEPDENLPVFCNRLKYCGLTNIIVIDDGSGEKYEEFFQEVKKIDGCTVLKHAVNQGKGRALKTAFNYILNHFSEKTVGCVTADSDGQHNVEDVLKCVNSLVENPNSLILGCRDFGGEQIPWKSRFGNELTKRICNYLCGIKISDTQTGLRGIPTSFMRILLNVPGERFEYETNMLIEAKGNYDFVEVPIETVYDSKDNHRTHFDPVKDSIRIYMIFGRIFSRYIISSISSFVIDILLFMLFCSLLRNKLPLYYVGISTVLARILSSIYNFIVNYVIVFRSKKEKSKSAVRYFTLAIVIMGLSAAFTTIIVWMLRPSTEAVIKIVVDVVLFFASYKIQQKIIF